MTKYHINKHGKYAVCNAGKRGCRYGTAGDINQAQYDQFVAAGDPRVTPQNKNEPEYLVKARTDVAKVLHEQKLYEEAEQEVKTQIANYHAETNMPSQIELITTMKHGKENKENALNRLKTLYINEGINSARARYLAEDIEKKDPVNLTPIKRSRDKYDADIKVKTERAIEIAKNDTEYLNAVEKHKAGLEANNKYQTVANKHQKIYNTVYAEKGLQRSGASYIQDRVVRAKNQLERMQKWNQANVPSNVNIAQIERLHANDLSVDKNGNINNAWVETDNGIEKIVSYEPPASNTYGSAPGNLITENGTKVSHFTHYANYRSYTNGKSAVLIAPKKGKQFTHELFRITGSIDSGD
jgi:hypothetical protein